MTTISESLDRKSTRLNSSHQIISYAVFCLKKKKKHPDRRRPPRGPHPPGRGTLGRLRGRGPRRLRAQYGADHLVVGFFFFFFFNDTAPPEIYPLSLHDALPI